MRVQKVAKTIFEDDSKMCLVVFVSVVSFLVISSVTILNVLITKELTRNLESLQMQILTHQEEIAILKRYMNEGNGREKRSLSQEAGRNETGCESSTESVPHTYKVETESTIPTSTSKKHIGFNHKKHHKENHGKKHHRKWISVVKTETFTSRYYDHTLNTPISLTTKQSVFTKKPESLNCTSQTSSDIKYITKRSYEPYYTENNSEFGTYTDEGVVMETPREARTRNTYVPSRSSRKRPLLSIHLSGDTSKYQLGVHENFKGNGHLKHPHSRFMDWVPSNWVHQHGMLNHFTYSDGYLTIKDSGIYFIYAQVHYYDEHDENAFRVYKNGQWFLQCTAAAHSATTKYKGSSCYTAAVEYFEQNDKIHLSDIVRDRYSIFETGKSFFGLIKL